MNCGFIKISVILCLLLAPGLVSSARAAGKLSGFAALAYSSYDAEVAGRKIYHTDTFAQSYSLAYSATNLRYRSQERYYSMKLGYDWMSYNTKIDGADLGVNSSQSFGKIRYSGEIGYNPNELPIRFRAYINDDQPASFKYSTFSNGLLAPGFIYDIDGRGHSVSTGFSFAFEPGKARTLQGQSLPRLLLDYRETTNNYSHGFTTVHNKTRELAVAGLNQASNWVHYRNYDYQNYLDPLDKYTRQQFQIGLVDNVGRRNWSALTNWIEVSADGQLTNTRSPSGDNQLEEYDVNFMAIASRKSWEARTFLNYNRQSPNSTARVPVNIKGIYGSDTSWYVSLSANQRREQLLGTNNAATTYDNSISLGGTTFKRSNFILSPSLSLSTSKSYLSNASYVVEGSLETASTSRFSDRSNLAARLTLRAMDNGTDSAESKTWSGFLETSGIFSRNNKLTVSVRDRAEIGNGSGYLLSERQANGNTLSSSSVNSTRTVGTYLRNFVYAEARWVPTANFSTTLSGSYDYVKAVDLPVVNAMTVFYQAAYNNNDFFYRLDSRYEQKSSNSGPSRSSWKNNAEISYRPNRYHDGLFRLAHDREHDVNLDSDRLDVVQRYSYNYFTRSGVIRNLGTLSEEYVYTGTSSSGVRTYSQSVMLSGRYSPTERLSLYGSAKYETGSVGSYTMYYAAGLNVDFRLLSASLNYVMAKRESDNRIEKKLNASVSRTF